MTRFLRGRVALACVVVMGLGVCAVCTPGADGGGYMGRGYTYYRPSCFSYYPTYSYPTIPTYSYSYPTYSYSYQQPAVKTVPKDWKTELLELARERDKVEGQIRKSQVEYQAFSSALRAMGLEGNFHYQNYGLNPAPLDKPVPYGYNRNFNLGTYGANGQTIYGYTYSSVKDLYGDNDLNSRFQEANRLAMNAQTLGGQATQQFQQAVSTEGTNRARVAEILARAQAASEALKAAAASPQQTETTTSFSIQQGSAQQQGSTHIQQGPPPGQGASGAASGSSGGPGSEAFVKLATAKCLPCHGPDKQEGKFDVRQYPAMSSAEKAKRVWPRLTHPDDNKRMPKDGKPLTAEELLLFYND